MKGISYGPTPVTIPAAASQLPEDDYFCDEAAPMWSSSGRGDLRIMSSMGANLVRLYGNDPRNKHGGFLDEAHTEGLRVAVGMSDWPFYQQVPGNCKDAADAFNCFTQIKPLYLDNLKKGFLRADKTYHPALRVVNVLNEPDLKMPPTATTGAAAGAKQMARSLISAFDAMLDAERYLGVTGPLVNFTATFSYAVCMACDRFQDSPALGQMAQLDDAMRHPEKYDYKPKNDITSAYKARWMHSFNTQNPATDLQHQFLDSYNQAFPATPVYIGEYHRVDANQTEDLDTILAAVESNELFVGISFFEYTVSYYKTGSEMDFGMFGYGNDTVKTMDYFGQELPVKCLAPVASPPSGTTMPEAVARVYGGHVDDSLMCGGGGSVVPITLPSSTLAPVTLPTTTTTGFLASTSTTLASTSTTSRAADFGPDASAKSAAALALPSRVALQACLAAFVSALAARER